MPVDPGLGTLGITKGWSEFLARWGIKSHLRSMANWVTPVAVVDRYRDDSEGSLRAMYCSTPGAVGQHPAVMIGVVWNPAEPHIDHQLEVITFNAWYQWNTSLGSSFYWSPFLHAFTPFSPYNPVSTLDPAGYYTSGLLTDKAFTRGHAVGLAGYTGSMPTYGGWPGYVAGRYSRYAQPGQEGRWFNAPDTYYLADTFFEDPPIRIHRDRGLAIQLENPTGNKALGFAVALLYRERTVYT